MPPVLSVIGYNLPNWAKRKELIDGTEFVAAGIFNSPLMVVLVTLAMWEENEGTGTDFFNLKEDVPLMLMYGVLHGVPIGLVNGTAVWEAGKMLNQRGKWWKATLSASIAATLWGCALYIKTLFGGPDDAIEVTCLKIVETGFIFVPLFAVIGYNLK